MKTKKIFCIITVLALFISSSLIVSASEACAVKAQITEAQNGYDILLSVSAPLHLESMGVTLSFNNNIFNVTEITKDNTDASAYKDVFSEDLPSENYFISDWILTDNIISFSGYFLDCLESNTDAFSFLRIRLTKTTEATLLNESIELHSTLSKAGHTINTVSNYSLISGNEISEGIVMKEHFMGDVDMDNKVTASDARLVLRHSVGLDKLPIDVIMYANPDFNNKISSADARHILRTAVGLEKVSVHSFEAVVSEAEDCENSNEYTFTCTVTGKSFSIIYDKAGHIYSEADCLLPVRCTICGEILSPAVGHEYDENGCCIRCKTTREETESIKKELQPIFEEMALTDTEAYEAVKDDNFKLYFEIISENTHLLKKAIELCRGNPSFASVSDMLSTAYSLRFNAFLQCTDEDGTITVSRKNYSHISNAVAHSNRYIDAAATTFRS